MAKIILLVISFFLGAVPFGYIVVYWRKKADIRKYGSGNIGATNVFRVAGKKWGILVFCLDFLKGFAVPFLAYSTGDYEPYFLIAGGGLAIAGHNWTPFLKFKGGKGVATSLGVLFALCFPFTCLKLILALTLCGWVIVFLLSRIVALASVTAGLIFLISALFLAEAAEIKIMAFILFFFILIRHRDNIKRIIKGRENKF